MWYFYGNIPESLPQDTPFVLLGYDDWNDWFEFETMYRLYYYSSQGNGTYIGRLKIGQQNQQSRRAEIPEAFEELDSSFFSVGETVDYYTTLYSLTGEVTKQILSNLNDIAFNTSFLIENSAEKVLNQSLLRDYTYKEIMGQVHRIAHGGVKLTNYEFTYHFPATIELDTKVIKVNKPAIFKINVYPDSKPPSNIQAIIGRNGVGKTFLLNNIIKAIKKNIDQEYTGYFSCSDPWDDKGIFEPKNEFANLICIAFSAFDSFPASEDIDNKPFGFPYIYIGLDEQQSELPRFEQLARQFYISLCRCLSSPAKQSLWKDTLDILNYDTYFDESGITNLNYPKYEKELKEFETKVLKLYERLSSGHKIILLTMVRLVENVEEKSLVIIDEPETHLHPPLLSAFIRALSELLIKRNAVAIIATHSPIILQEIPAKCAWKMRRSGAEVSLCHIEQESFGTNINSLIREVFRLEIEKSGFHELLQQDLHYNEYNVDKVREIYNNELGDDALAMLRILSQHKGVKE